MCSVSWQWRDSSDKEAPLLSVYFNRDEQRSRELATPPMVQDLNGVSAILPTDPQRGGTWIASNQHGLTIALLNNYSVLLEKDTSYESRGFIVKTLAEAVTIEEASQTLETLVNQHSFPAFSLLLWDTKTTEQKLFHWNQTDFSSSQLGTTFFTSSSWNTEAVQHHRAEQFKAKVLAGIISHADFHSTTPLGEEKESVYMSRELTQTVSRTYVFVTSSTSTMEYFDRATETTSSCSLELNKL